GPGHKRGAAGHGGTLQYMARELLAADGAERGDRSGLLTPQADLFSFGVLVYELLSGRHPFGPISLKLSIEKLRMHLLQRQQAPPMPLRLANPEVDSQLASVVERCLGHDPEERPQSAREVAASLRRCLSRRGRLRRWAAVRRKTVIGAALVSLAACVALVHALMTRAPYSEREFQRGLDAYARADYESAR